MFSLLHFPPSLLFTLTVKIGACQMSRNRCIVEFVEKQKQITYGVIFNWLIVLFFTESCFKEFELKRDFIQTFNQEKRFWFICTLKVRDRKVRQLFPGQIYGYAILARIRNQDFSKEAKTFYCTSDWLWSRSLPKNIYLLASKTLPKFLSYKKQQ